MGGKEHKKGDIQTAAEDRPARKPRADSLRNREALIETARGVFAKGGPDASLEAVARGASVGIGTLYRHFPTREALFQAVYRREIDELVDLAHDLSVSPDRPCRVDSLRLWTRAAVRMVATKRGMMAVLSPAAGSSDALYAECQRRLFAAVDGLLGAAAAGGEIRGDLKAQDFMRVLYGICYANSEPGWQDGALSMLDIFIDGLLRR